MRRHRLRNKIKSIVGSHIDPDKDEELKGSNIETEDNYTKILELLNKEDGDDKSKLVELIEEFHKHYQSIYERYDLVTGKLREKLYSKKENDSSSSSSSDSDSSGSSNKKCSKNGNSQNEIYIIADSLKDELQAANTEIDNLKRKLTVETAGKEALISQVEESKLEADRLHEENSRLLADNRDLNSKIEDINKEKVSLMLEHETSLETIQEGKRNNEELRMIIVGLESELNKVKGEFSKIKDLEQEINLLCNLKIELDTETDRKNQEISECLIQIECLKDDVANKNADEERLVSKINDLEAEIKGLKTKMDEMVDETEKGILSKDRIIDQLEETIEDLRSDLEIKGDEIGTLTETVRNLEVKIRLANQKLRVTEQTLNEQESDYARKEEKLHQENKSLIDKISRLTETITSIRSNVHETLTGIDSLAVKFEEDYGHLQTRVYEINNEIQAAQIHVKKTRSEKEELKQTVAEMAVKLKVADGENERLKKSMEEMQKKINELENTIHLKDEGILDLGEEKREAIRQLCMWVDYQRDRCHHLQQLLLKTTTSGWRQTAVSAR